MKEYRVVVSLLLLLCGTISAREGTDPGLTCVRVEVTLPGPGDEIGAVRLTNNCGNDITAFRVVFHNPADGSEVGAANRDTLGWIVASPTSPDILRKDTSTTFRAASFGAAVPSITAILFADRSTLGEPVQVSSLVKTRAGELQLFEEELSALNSVADWNDALALRKRVGEVKPRNHSLGRYLEDLAERQERSNIQSWDAFVGQQRRLLKRLIELFEFHLGKRTDLTGDRKP